MYSIFLCVYIERRGEGGQSKRDESFVKISIVIVASMANIYVNTFIVLDYRLVKTRKQLKYLS